MTRAEKRAIDAFPHDVFQGEDGDAMRMAYMLGYGQAESDCSFNDMGKERLCEAGCPHFGKDPDECGYDDGREECPYYRYIEAGYELAEKDLALTPEDMGVIFNLVRELQYKYNDLSGCYEEALGLFNKARNEAGR